MSTVFFSVGMSLDGYIAPEGMDMEHAFDPTYRNWMQRWDSLQQWVHGQKFFRENTGFGEGGETGSDNQRLEDTFARTGVSIMGKRMFEGGAMFWPENAPFHTPVFVLTHEQREPWVRPGGTIFHFVTDGIESALRQAREAVGDRDIRIAGGGDAIRQYLRAGHVDEFHIALAPVFLDGGVRLFEGIDPDRVAVEAVSAVQSPLVTHLSYSVTRR